MFESKAVYRRKCSVCKEAILSPPVKDGRTYHCVSLPVPMHGGRPASCWRNSGNPLAEDILAAIPAYRQTSRPAETAQARRVALAADILEATSRGTPDIREWSRLVEKHSLKLFTLFTKGLPQSSPLKRLLESVLPLVVRNPAAKRRTRDRPSLPADFARAIQMYTEASQRRLALKLQRGHHYRTRSAQRRTDAALKFCEFLAERGLQFWPEVAQNDLDEYLDKVNRAEACHAYTFLLFVRGNFRLTQNLIRPKRKRKPASEAVFDVRRMPDILAKIVQHPDVQVAVAALFLSLFAQPVARCKSLRMHDFRRGSGGRLQAKFAEEWVSLDELTEQFLCQYLPEFSRPDFHGPDEPLFRCTERFLLEELKALVGVPLKPLRLAAVANLIHAGITDRVTINRLLGVSLSTLAYVEGIMPWDLQRTVPTEVVNARNEVIRGERRA